MKARLPDPARASALAAVLALAFAFLGGVAAPPGASAVGPLPACRYDDLLTAPRGEDDWSITLVDTILRLPRSYEPPDLVSVSQAGINGSGKVRSIVIDDLRAMTEAAAAAAAPIAVQSAYRSYDSQVAVFARWVRDLGVRRARQVSARPGHSEHQLGVTVDFKTRGGGSPFLGEWGKTPAGRWMKAHAWEYGFVMSYPKGKLNVVCYDFEPWHFRYVGRDLAAEIHASGLTLREFLWRNFTTTVVPGRTHPPNPPPGQSAPPGTSPSPAPSPGGSPASSVEPSTSPPASAPPGSEEPSSAPSESPPSSATPGSPEPIPTMPPPPPIDVTEWVVGPVAGAALLIAALALVSWMVLRRRRPG